MSKVAQALREARITAGLQQQDVARALGISAPYLSDMEHGRRELGRQYLGLLPETMRPAVLAAWIAAREDEIAEARKAST